MAENWTVGFHARDNTEIDITEEVHEDGTRYFTIGIGPMMKRVTIFASPVFMSKLILALSLEEAVSG